MTNNGAKIRALAFYLPQFHPIPENDRWWSKGFTEWTNVGKAKPLFRNHYQPKVPADLGYYDLRVEETRIAQAELARQYGIEGFCYWHYWFGNGRQLLERPFNEVLASGKPDFPFCLAWANESWRGFFHGLKSNDTLIDQLYPGQADIEAHFYEVLPAFTDKRYICVDGKPLFMIYHPFDGPDTKQLIDTWRDLAQKNGLKGIFFVGQTYDLALEREKIYNMGFDAISVVRLYNFENHIQSDVRMARWKQKIFKRPYVVEYKKACRCFVTDEEKELNVIPTIIPNWDHTPRTGRRGLVLNNAEPEYFDLHLCDVDNVLRDKPLEHRIAFIKSWNEWAEGNYLEPDLRYGTRYLETLKKHIYGLE